MKIKITGKELKITEAINDYVEKNKLLKFMYQQMEKNTEQ